MFKNIKDIHNPIELLILFCMFIMVIIIIIATINKNYTSDDNKIQQSALLIISSNDITIINNGYEIKFKLSEHKDIFKLKTTGEISLNFRDFNYIILKIDKNNIHGEITEIKPITTN